MPRTEFYAKTTSEHKYPHFTQYNLSKIYHLLFKHLQSSFLLVTNIKQAQLAQVSFHHSM